MGILDGIVDWLATQVMNLLDLASTSVLGALDCNMDTFKRYFPAASAMYEIFIWTAIGLVLLNLVWQLYRCYGAGFDIDTENPTNLVVRSVIFLLLIWYCDDIVNLALQIGGTPYNWILDSNLPGVQFGDFNSVLLVIIGVIANGSVALIALILVMVLAWNYLKLLLEAAERYEMIEAVETLLGSIEYKELVEKYVGRRSLLRLAIALREQYIQEKTDSLHKEYVNSLITSVKKELSVRSSTTAVPDIDLYQILMNQHKVQVFHDVVKMIKKPRVIQAQNLYSYRVVAQSSPFSGALAMQKVSRSKTVFSDAFKEYNDPYKFLQVLKGKDIPASVSYTHLRAHET